MSELEKLQKEFNLRKEQLQNNCLHPKLSDWLEEWRAIAHTTGYLVQCCEICGKIIHRKIACNKCGSEIQDDEIKEGNGSRNFPIGMTFCKKCLDT